MSEEKCRAIAMSRLENADEIAKLNPALSLELWNKSPEELKEFMVLILELGVEAPRAEVSDEIKKAIDHEFRAA